MPSTTAPKKILVFFAAALFFASQSFSQNVGINTTLPEASLDINGDIIIRTAPITVADGITLALDVNTARFSYYRITGPTADFTLAGITAGIDGRLVTLFNQSGFTIQLNNEDATVALPDMIVTGTNANITIINKGIVTLQYDATEQKWIVKSSSKGVIPTPGYWDTDGSNIFTNNTGNTGVKTSTPQGVLDVNGDIVLRTSDIAVADGITPALDVNTTRFSYYRITGPTADFTLAGIAAGVDGRLVTLFNRSGFTMQLNNEDATVAAADMIVTGTNADITLLNKGIINLQYDGTEQKWIVKSSSKGVGPGGPGYWDLNGNDLFNNTGGNVGIGTSSPVSKFTMLTGVNTMGWTHIGQVNGVDSIIVSQGIGGVSASLGTATNHAFRLNTGGTGKIHIYPAGEVVVGTNTTPVIGKFTVETPNNSNGISHISDQGNVLMTRIGGTSAGIGTFSNTHMRIFCNSTSQIFITAATGNIGMGTENTGAHKLSVNGTIRSKEVVVETGWADYVFDKNYKLPLLSDVEKFIQLNKHLPNIPSAAAIEKNGLHLGDIQKRMMEKIEELTLYVIDLKKEIDLLRNTLSKKDNH